MIAQKSIKQYKGAVISGNDNHLYIPPSILLRPYISHYCVSFPTPLTMSDSYTVLPSANSVLVISVRDGQIGVYYNGTNSKAIVVGKGANKDELLLLVKFRTGGFYNFYRFNQSELVDCALDLNCIDKTLEGEVINGLIKSKSINELIQALDNIFLKRLINNNDYIIGAMNKIIALNGNITSRELSQDLYYSEKHMRRLFLQHVGVSTKKFSRIVRINYALQLLKDSQVSLLDVAETAGFYDQPHFIHDFKDIFNLTPSEYINNMSDFYNSESF